MYIPSIILMHTLIQEIREAMIDLHYLRFETCMQIEDLEMQGENTECEQLRIMKYENIIERLAEYIQSLPTDHELD